MEGSSGKHRNGCDAMDVERTLCLIFRVEFGQGSLDFPCSETQFQMISMQITSTGSHCLFKTDWQSHRQSQNSPLYRFFDSEN